MLSSSLLSLSCQSLQGGSLICNRIYRWTNTPARNNGFCLSHVLKYHLTVRTPAIVKGPKSKLQNMTRHLHACSSLSEWGFRPKPHTWCCIYPKLEARCRKLVQGQAFLLPAAGTQAFLDCQQPALPPAHTCFDLALPTSTTTPFFPLG